MQKSKRMAQAVTNAAVVIFMVVGTGHAWAESPTLNAKQVVEKNLAARGGLHAWEAITSISYSGTMDAGRISSGAGNGRDADGSSMQRSRLTPGQRRALLATAPKQETTTTVALPFRLEMKRPRKSRLELDFAGSTSIQLYDGNAGWKLRPYMGQTKFQPFSAVEAKLAAAQPDLDGLLLQSVRSGRRIEMDGMENIAGSPAYRLKVTQSDGSVRKVWIDSKSFLDVQVDGARPVGAHMRNMVTHLQDYRAVGSVVVPFILETLGEGMKTSERIVVDKVVLNPELSDARFTKPALDGE